MFVLPDNLCARVELTICPIVIGPDWPSIFHPLRSARPITAIWAPKICTCPGKLEYGFRCGAKSKSSAEGSHREVFVDRQDVVDFAGQRESLETRLCNEVQFGMVRVLVVPAVPGKSAPGTK